MKKFISVLVSSALIMSVSAPIASSAQSTAVSEAAVVAYLSKAPSKIKLSVSKKTVYVGQKYKISVKSVTPSNASKAVTWKSSDTSVATVSSTGVITGKSAGTAVITAVSKDNKKIKSTCKVTVKDYGKKDISYNSAAVVFDVPSDDYSGLTDSTVVISSYKQRNEAIRYIKANYPEYSKVVAQLKKYDVEFFNDNSLIYNRTVTNGASSAYVKADVTNCLKKFSGGKLTAYVKAAYSENVPSDEDTNTEYYTRFNCYFTAVEKSAVKNVENFKIIEKQTAGKNFPRTVIDCPVKAVLESTDYDIDCPDDTLVINSVDELNKLTDTIKKYYPDNENILTELSAYDESYFESNSLFYSRRYEEGYANLEYYEYSFKPTVVKMVKGVVTIYLKPQIDFKIPDGVDVSNEVVGRNVCYIAELDKNLAVQIEAGVVV
jgi:hypothetical protein